MQTSVLVRSPEMPHWPRSRASQWAHHIVEQRFGRDAVIQPFGNGRETVSQALREGQRLLAATGSESPRLDAEVLLRHTLGIDRTTLFARLAEPIDSSDLASFRGLLAERAGGTPVAYLTGVREFMGLDFIVGPGVLIPRPETEILVAWALEWLRTHRHATVLDVGAGSGAIALSIAALVEPGWAGHIIGSDVSAAALAVAARNRDRLGLAGRVELLEGSLVSWRDEPVALLLANLPYLRPAQIAGNPQLAAEPRSALDGGSDGLDLIRALLLDAPRVMAPGGAIGLEIDPSQRRAVMGIAKRAFPRAAVAVLPDLAGLDRHVVITTAATS